MNLTTICIVRHGQTDWNLQHILQGQEDIPLNETGKIQAQQSANFLKNKKNWDVIVSSNLGRARETAQIIADEIGITTIQLDERLIERDMGEASGKNYLHLTEKLDNREIDGMESDNDLVARSYKSFLDITSKYKGKNIIIVSHSETIKGILLGIDPTTNYFKIRLKNACACMIEEENSKFLVREINISNHILV